MYLDSNKDEGLLNYITPYATCVGGQYSPILEPWATYNQWPDLGLLFD